MRLTTPCGVAARLNLLTYSTVCCAVSARNALPAAVIRYFLDGFKPVFMPVALQAGTPARHRRRRPLPS